MDQPTAISVLIPTIRPNFTERCVKNLMENHGMGQHMGKDFEIEVLADQDDDRIGCPKMVKRMTEAASHDWVMFIGDDTIPQKDFMRIAFDAAATLPDGWGMVGLNDKFHPHGIPSTHWLAHKQLLPLIGGEFFHTGYGHCYCDRELTDRCRALGKWRWAEEAVVVHDHPIVQGKPLLGDYARVYNRNMMIKDLQLYTIRRRKEFKDD